MRPEVNGARAAVESCLSGVLSAIRIRGDTTTTSTDFRYGGLASGAKAFVALHSILAAKTTGQYS